MKISKLILLLQRSMIKNGDREIRFQINSCDENLIGISEIIESGQIDVYSVKNWWEEKTDDINLNNVLKKFFSSELAE